MTRSVVTVSPDAQITTAARLLLGHDVTALPVVDRDGRLLGIVSRSDLIRGRVLADPRAHLRPAPVDASPAPRTVGDEMTREVVTLPPEADEADFAHVMLDRGVNSVPVVSEDGVVGMVSVTDLLRLGTRSDAEIAVDVRSRLAELAPGRWGVTVDGGVVTLSGDTSASRGALEAAVATVPGVVRVRHQAGEPDGEPPVPADHDPRMRGSAPTDHRGLVVLGLEECLDRLRSVAVGRLAFVHAGSPVVVPVNHGVDGSNVVFRTTWGSKLQVAEDAATVAFEVDGIDPGRRAGWSVLVKGTAETVYDDPDIERYEAMRIPAWAGLDDAAVWIRLRPDEVTGRQIVR